MTSTVELFDNLGENATLLIILGLAYVRLDAHLRAARPWQRSLIGGLLFAIVAIGGMFLPVVVAPGVLFDGRPVVVMAAAALTGWIGGLAAALLVAAWRLYLGGAGALPGIGGVITAALIGVLLGTPFGVPRWRRRLAMAALVTLGSIAWVYAVPHAIAPDVARTLTFAIVIYLPAALLLLFAVIGYELRQHERERALERSEQRFRAIFNSTFQMIGLLTPDGTILESNRTALDAIGAGEREVLGRKLWETPWCIDDPGARHRLRAAIRRAAAGHFVRFETVIGGVHREGENHIDFSLQPIRDAGGAVVMLLPEGRNISQRKRTEAKLAQAEEHLRQAQKMEAVGQLTGGIAHDFNNLLTVVGGNLELLQRRQLDDDHRRLIDAAMRGVSRGATLTQQLLAFSRKQRLMPEVVEVAPRVRDIAAMLQRLLGESIEVRTVFADDLRLGYFDPHQMETALLNLAINARDAMPQGGTLTIRTENGSLAVPIADEPPRDPLGSKGGGKRGVGRTEVRGAMAREVEARRRGFVVLSVADTGVGMSPDVLRRAVEPFFTTKEVGRGSGLGLSMVYGFVTQSGGHIDLASEPGKGTVVRLYLPTADPAKHSLPSERVRPSAREAGGGEVVLVVEDELEVRAMATQLLRDLGYDVREASDGADALELLRDDGEIDLLFADLAMPGMGGIELAEAARQLRPDLPILFTSGHPGGRASLDGGTDIADFIAKPFQRAELAGKLRDLLGRARTTLARSSG